VNAENLDKKRQLILNLVAARRGQELALMLLGASKYSRRENDASVKYPESFRRADPQGNVASDAISHLEFTARFGTELASAEEGGRRHFAHPAEFGTWLDHGAPGLFINELEAYIADNPL
jgi:hypothetical protein